MAKKGAPNLLSDPKIGNLALVKSNFTSRNNLVFFGTYLFLMSFVCINIFYEFFFALLIFFSFFLSSGIMYQLGVIRE